MPCVYIQVVVVIIFLFFFLFSFSRSFIDCNYIYLNGFFDFVRITSIWQNYFVDECVNKILKYVELLYNSHENLIDIFLEFLFLFCLCSFPNLSRGHKCPNYKLEDDLQFFLIWVLNCIWKFENHDIWSRWTLWHTRT